MIHLPGPFAAAGAGTGPGAHPDPLQQLHTALVTMAHQSADCTAEMAACLQPAGAAHAARAERIVQLEQTLNRLEDTIEPQVIQYLAVRNAIGRDLRFALAALKIAADLERIGDKSLEVIRRLERMAGYRPAAPQDTPRGNVVAPPPALVAMLQQASTMVAAAVAALEHRDTARARQLAQEEQVLDRMNPAAIEFFTEEARARRITAAEAIQWVLITRHVERIGDMAHNIGQNVIFVLDGSPVNHRDEPSKAASAGNGDGFAARM